ncbi:MAG TPA: class I adenylate-forming enzyme family protein [Pyrinomonadaceae bacterium]
MKTINDYMAASISRSPESTLLVEWSTGEEITYGSFGDHLSRIANVLKSENVSEGDVITLIADNSIDIAIMFFGVIAYGAIAMPLNPRLTPSEIANLLDHSGSKLVFVDRELDFAKFEGRVRPIAAYRNFETSNLDLLLSRPLSEEAGAELIYTSGTTGTPKGILLSHRNIVHNVTTAIDRLRLDSSHTKLCLLPLFHNFAFISDLSAGLFTGAKVVIMEGFDVAKLASLESALHHHGVNSFSAVPLMFELFVRFDCRINAPSMKFCVSGAAPLTEKVALAFLEKYGFPIIPAYGLTESTCFCTISPLDNIVFSSIGAPADNEIKIVSDEYEELPTGEVGELIIKGASVMRGLHFKREESCFVDSERTWLMTGDLGYYDENGLLYIAGRKKSMVIRGGEKVYLEDMDVCLKEMAGVAESATVRFDEGDVEKIACVVVLSPGSQLSSFDISAYVRARMGQFKCPDVIIFKDKIPRTATSKVKSGELQEMVKNYRSQNGSPRS